MARIPRARGPRNVAVLAFEGMQIVDFAAPYEVLGQAGLNVYTVASSKQPITTAMGLRVIPSYSFKDCPAPDVLLLPGGDGVEAVSSDRQTLDWVVGKCGEVDYILTVCNGAFILAETGLLDGKVATTFYRLLGQLQQVYPEVHVVSDRRYADSGKVVTTAGLSSGIDGALYLVSRMQGRAAAQRVALHMEYNWLDDVSYARASFADLMLIRMSMVDSAHYPLLDAEGTRWKLESTHGGSQDWEFVYSVEGATDRAALQAVMESKFQVDGSWTRLSEGQADAEGVGSSWRFESPDGEAWKALVSVVGGEEDSPMTVRFAVHRIEPEAAPKG